MENTETKKNEELKEALDKSSEHNRRLLMLFLLVMIYVLITTASTTGLDLLVPDSKVRLPLINVEIPLFGFYIVAPILVIAFHFNLLFNLFIHSKKFHQWYKPNQNEKELLSYPYLFNYAFMYKWRKIIGFLLLSITGFLVYWIPLIVLIVIAIKFLPYHQHAMTLWHKIAITIDAYLIFLLWKKAKHPEWGWNWVIKKVRDESKKYSRSVYLFIRFMTLFYLKDIIIFSLILFYVWTVIAIPKTNGETFITPISIKKKSNQREDKKATGKLLFEIPFKTFNIQFGLFERRISDVIHRNLKLTEKTLVTSPPSDVIIAEYLRQGKSEEEAWKAKAKGLDLQGRDVRFADFYESNLLKADLRKAQLQGADLEHAELQGADLRYTELQGAYLEHAQLQGAYLGGAQLQGADLGYAQLQGADLGYAQLQGADLKEAQLQGAYLYFAELQGANLGGAQLQGANLAGAELQGAELELARLQGANLLEAQFRCTNLNNANLQGIYAKNINTKININWDVLLNEIKPLIPEKTDQYFEIRASFIKRIEETKKRCKDFKEDDALKLKDLIEKSSHYAKFIEARKKHVCKNVYTAKGMLNQYILDNETTEKSKKAITGYMESNCPDILKKDEKKD